MDYFHSVTSQDVISDVARRYETGASAWIFLFSLIFHSGCFTNTKRVCLTSLGMRLNRQLSLCCVQEQLGQIPPE